MLRIVLSNATVVVDNFPFSGAPGALLYQHPFIHGNILYMFGIFGDEAFKKCGSPVIVVPVLLCAAQISHELRGLQVELNRLIVIPSSNVKMPSKT